jgi:hypothetical protein
MTAEDLPLAATVLTTRPEHQHRLKLLARDDRRDLPAL